MGYVLALWGEFVKFIGGRAGLERKKEAKRKGEGQWTVL